MHPDLANDWRAAKRAAAAIGQVIGAELVQKPDGRKVVLYDGRVIPCVTWLAAYSFVSRIRADQIKSEAARQVKKSGREVVRDRAGNVIPYAIEV